MALQKRGKYWYGETVADLQEEMQRYSRKNGYAIDHTTSPRCECGAECFLLELDERSGAAVRTCRTCQKGHPIGDSEQFLPDASLDQMQCICGNESFELSAGVSLFPDSQDVRWLYIGCRCPDCGMVGVYGDWKNEFEGYTRLLEMI